MKLTLVLAAIIVAFVVGAFSQRNAKGLNVNDRWMMRGAKCTPWKRINWSVPSDQQQDQFQELAKVRVSKTYDKKQWVIGFEDFGGCRLSFWAESGEEDTSIPVTALTTY